MTYEDLKKARERALRAAQVVTLGLALAGGSIACSDREDATVDSGGGDSDSGMMTADSGTPGTDSGTPGTDSGTPGTDSGTPGTDSGTPGTDSGTPGTDSGTPMADAGCVPDSMRDCICPAGDPSDCDCCIESGGFCGPEGSCAVPGPFVPPSATV